MILGLVQARMGSARLPGKVLMDLHGQPMIQHVLDRVARCPGLDGVVLCTTTLTEDDELARWAERAAWPVFRGAGEDVLARYATAAEHYGADIVMRVTGDCPLWSPSIGGYVLALYRHGSRPAYGEAALWTNSPVERTGYADGYDVEVLSHLALIVAAGNARPEQREHVTTYYRDTPGETHYVCAPGPWIGPKLSVDTQEDLDRVREWMR